MKSIIDSELPILFVVGAGRSGTNFLSKALAEDQRFTNLFENRYVWNYRSRNLRSDRRDASDASDKVITYIREHFDQMRINNGGILIDKTPGNALRLDFVLSVFPEAKIINIIRDGRNNVLSREALWGDTRSEFKRGPALTRMLDQIRFMHRNGNIPFDRWPVFILDNIALYLPRIVFGRTAMAGERVPGMYEISKKEGTLRARAFQWSQTVRASTAWGNKVSKEAYMQLRLEDLMKRPDQKFSEIYEFLGLEASEAPTSFVHSKVDLNRADKWKQTVSQDQIKMIEEILTPDLDYLGYK